MGVLDDFRAKYPMYNDMPDSQLAKNIHKTFYANMPRQEYSKRLGFDPFLSEDIFQAKDYKSPRQAAVQAGKNLPSNLYGMAESVVKGVADLPFNSPKEYGKSAMQGLVKGAQSLLNVPHNVVEYWREDAKRRGEPIPDWLKAWKPSEETTQQLDKYAQYWQPDNPDAPANQLIKGLSQSVPSAIATGGIIPGLFAQAVGENRNPLEDVAAIKSVPGTVKAIKKVGEPVGKVASKTASAIKEPFKKYGESVDLERSILESKKDLFAAEEQKSVAINKIQETFNSHLQSSKKVSRENLAQNLKSASKELKQTGSEMYEDFKKTSWGQKRIFKPIMPEFFDKQYPIPREALSETTANLIDKTFGTYSVKETRNPLTGKYEYKINKNSKGATVSDYIELAKHLRDEAASFRKRASAQDISHGDAGILRNHAQSLERLMGDMQEKIVSTLPDKAATKYQGIQNFWKDYVTPWEESATLSKISTNHPSISTPKFLEALQKEGYGKLTDAMLENPVLAESIGKHDFRAIKPENSKNFIEALEGDLGRTLPENLRKELKNDLKILQDSEKTIEALKLRLKEQGLTKTEIDLKLNKYKKLGFETGKWGAALFAAKLLLGII